MVRKKRLWELKQGKKIFLPLTTARIQRWIDEGRVKEDDVVWRSGFPSWKKLGEIEEFKPFFKTRKKPKIGL